MCSEKDERGQYYINEQTQNTAIKLINVLMAKYSIPIENVIRHYDVTGKMCPESFIRNQVQWLDFKQKLIEIENNEKEENKMLYNKIDDVPKWAKPTIQKLIDKGAFVGITYDMLRMYVSHDRMRVYDR